ncbi:ECF transporter S component [Acetivibrio clariflavus]|uniref:Putative membrane protein n=1 Tax=Acetivibrio clariflavus (strain DSM 19732 / NBRC 101661 / EBR45) TaxID=720554 RepID=G8LSS6_ACECE|nr:ECF transporter S component [Acetivibrio clariflavus]AEV69428.1 putative membrane protein [Acetivibrio clariflavus DSM 19732]
MENVNNNSKKTKTIILNGLMIALVLLVTMFTKIPGPLGYFNIGDTAIIIAAVMLGRRSGFIAGAFGSALADILLGVPYFAPITFVVKGLEGFIIGHIIYAAGDKKRINSEIIRIFAIVVGCIVMVAGYFFSEIYILRLFSTEYGYAKALSELPYNLVQGGISAIIGYGLSTSLSRIKAVTQILN